MANNKLFEIICQHKDTEASNLNKVFESYGCQTLEAKVPVVSEQVVEELMGIKSSQQQLYANLTLKAESSELAMRGKMARTRNRAMKIVQVNGETLLATGEAKEEEPVEEEELDEELEAYMREGARLRGLKQMRLSAEAATAASFSGSDFPPLCLTEDPEKDTKIAKVEKSPVEKPRSIKDRIGVPQASCSSQKPTTSQKKVAIEINEEDLDREIDEYMRELERIKEQKRNLEAMNERAAAMARFDDMEEDVDVDFDL